MSGLDLLTKYKQMGSETFFASESLLNQRVLRRILWQPSQKPEVLAQSCCGAALLENLEDEIYTLNPEFEPLRIFP